MGTFFAYSIQSALCLVLFYLFYKVLLSRETFHRFNRGALLGILAFSVIIPTALAYVSFRDLFTFKSSGEFLREDLDFVSDAFSSDIYMTDRNQAGYAGVLSALLWVYLIGCVVCLFFMIVASVRIVRIICKGECVSKQNGIRLILSNDKQISFSWMNFVVISRHDYEEAGEIILAHEMAHIRLLHTFDLALAQICIVTQWFNPAAWLLYQELHHIHEFEADEVVLRQGVDTRQYQLLLIKKAVGTRLYSMANSFNHSTLKKRITMMLQKKSKAWARLKYAYVLPLAATTLVVLAHPKVSHQFEEISTAKVNHFALETSLNETEFSSEVKKTAFIDSVFAAVERMPEFPGGEAELMKFIAERLVYPQAAAENKIEGRVGCVFVVEKDGSVSNVEVKRPIDPLLDKEAVRVLSELPKFTPGKNGDTLVRVLYSVPVRFKLTPSDGSASTNSSPALDDKAKEVSESFVFVTVEQMPQYPGGDEALLEDIAANIQYPKAAAEKGLEGRVGCTFIVEADGSISNVIVARSVDPLLDKEAVRVLETLKTLKTFTPGKQRGKAVRVKYSVPVRFRLPKAEATETAPPPPAKSN